MTREDGSATGYAGHGFMVLTAVADGMGRTIAEIPFGRVSRQLYKQR